MVFTPFYLPIVGLVALFTFSYMSIFPWIYKLQVLIMVYLFTILLPTVLIHLYRRYQGWSLIIRVGASSNSDVASVAWCPTSCLFSVISVASIL